MIARMAGRSRSSQGRIKPTGLPRSRPGIPACSRSQLCQEPCRLGTDWRYGIDKVQLGADAVSSASSRWGWSLLILEFEPDPHLNLEVRDLILLDVPADTPNLDPVEPAQRFCGAGDARLHRFAD